MPGIYPLQGIVKHYDWGGDSFIPALLQIENNDRQPFAEYWMGTHPNGISRIRDEKGNWKNITEYDIHLSYLLKVLDVKDMLSIQVHPSKTAAEKEFARENAEGVPLDSPNRNYKDNNHKPELMVALSDFWLLHGFKPTEELVYILLNVVELRELLPIFNQSGYRGLYQYIMEMPQPEVNRILKPLVDNLQSVYPDSEPDREEEDYWAARAANTFSEGDAIDRGIFSIYLFNLVHLKKGEGIFQGAGVPHAYLEGQNVEIMANSDNVLRGGLTRKHIDVKELLKHVKSEATHPVILERGAGAEKLFKTPAPDFSLEVFELSKDEKIEFLSVADEILLLTEGVVEISEGNDQLQLQAGSPAAFVRPGHKITIKPGEKARLFRAMGGLQ